MTSPSLLLALLLFAVAGCRSIMTAPAPQAGAEADAGERSHEAAAMAKPAVQAPVGRAPATRPSSSIRRYHGQRISLDLKDADVHNVLRLIADVSGLSVVVTDDVEGKVTMRFAETPWDEVLDATLGSLGLGSRRTGRTLRISTLQRLREEDEEAKRGEEARAEIEPLYTEYLRPGHASAEEIAQILRGESKNSIDSDRRGGSGFLSHRGFATVDPPSNTLIVRDVMAGVENARDLVAQLDQPRTQVLIEARLVETAADLGRALGVQWGYHASLGPQTGHSTGTNFPGTIGAGGSGLGAGTGGVPFIADFPAPVGPSAGSALDLALGSLDGSHALDLRISALEREGKARIVSQPRIVTLNNVAATIKSLTVLRVKLPSTDTIIGGEGEVRQSPATERIETGIILVVTPRISSDGFVLLDLFAKSSQADFTRSVDGIPVETSREATSHILVPDGHTVVLGGIYAESQADERLGVPFFNDLPALGWLFGRVDRSRRTEDLLVFLTPRILRAPGATLPSAAELWQDRFPGEDGRGQGSG